MSRTFSAVIVLLPEAPCIVMRSASAMRWQNRLNPTPCKTYIVSGMATQSPIKTTRTRSNADVVIPEAFCLPAQFQHESNWSSIFSPHFGQSHMASHLMESISDPAPIDVQHGHKT